MKTPSLRYPVGYNPDMMRLAYRLARQSTCNRLHVGATLLDTGGHIVANAWNENPAAYPCVCAPDGAQCDNTLHSEMACILMGYREISKHRPGFRLPKADAYGCLSGWTLYVTHAPCRQCAVSIGTAGISTVFYAERYGNTRGTDYLSAINTVVCQVSYEESQ